MPSHADMARELTYAQAINEAIDLSMARDPSVYLMGLGVPDPKGVFGSTLGLLEKYGPDRVLDMPTSENGMTGVAIGTALVGMRPIMTHQRVEFAMLALEQIVNQAAKWHYMFGGRVSIPLVIRMIVGRGWGQGPQHSQSLQAWFAHIPGLKVVMPTTPYDAKGLLMASVEDNNPVIVLEHRWLYNIQGPVPEGPYRVPLGRARVMRGGEDVTLVGVSYMSLEAMRAAEVLAEEGVQAEVIDVRSLRPLDDGAVIESVRKTGRLVVADTGWGTAGISAELIARVAEDALEELKSPPRRIALPECPTPTTAALADHYYPRAAHIVATVRQLLGREAEAPAAPIGSGAPLDVPDKSFTGPF